MIIRILAVTFCFTLSINFVWGQGCSDAGFCTIGNHANLPEFTTKPTHKNEIDIVYIYGTHGRNERFYQPQINYRFIKKSGAFFEIRLPLNIAKNIATNISTTGIGDAIATYNSNIAAGKNRIDYSVGFRFSFSHSDKSDNKGNASYPMYLQSGLGTTDLIAVAGYDIGKYISVGTGVQVPILQYNDHIFPLADNMGMYSRKGYRRRPDALLKITGHYGPGKIKLSAGMLSIFHLANDYYKTSSSSKYIMENSQGTTVNVNAELGYAFAKNITLSFLFAEPIVTRKNIPDGLARSRIYSPKLTFTF